MPRKGTTAAAWAHRSTYPLDLPSGVTVTVRPLSLARCIAYGQVPSALSAIAFRVEYKDDPLLDADMKPGSAEHKEFEDFRDWAISEALVEPKVTPEWVRKSMPPDDRQPLWEAAAHGRFVDPRVTALLELAGFRSRAAGIDAAGSGASAGEGPE